MSKKREWVGKKIGQLPVFNSKAELEEAHARRFTMSDESSRLDAEIAEVQQRFDKLEGERQELVKQREGFVKQVSELDKRLSAYLETIIRVQGEHQALTRLKEKVPVPTEKPN